MTWTSETLMEVVRAFQPACILTAAADLDLFSQLTDTPKRIASLAQTMDADERALEILLDALTALNLINKCETGYSIQSSTAALLCSQGTNTILPGIQHLGNCLRSWSRLAHTVKQGQPTERSPSIRGE